LLPPCCLFWWLCWVWCWCTGCFPATWADLYAWGTGRGRQMFKVEAASLAADGSVRLFIRNIGGAPVHVSTVYVYPVGSLNPPCVKHGINAVISPGTLAAVETMLTCTPSSAPGGSYVIKVVTARGTEYAYIVTTSPTLAAVATVVVEVVIAPSRLPAGSGLGRLTGRRQRALTSLTAGLRRGVPPAVGLGSP